MSDMCIYSVSKCNTSEIYLCKIRFCFNRECVYIWICSCKRNSTDWNDIFLRYHLALCNPITHNVGLHTGATFLLFFFQIGNLAAIWNDVGTHNICFWNAEKELMAGILWKIEEKHFPQKHMIFIIAWNLSNLKKDHIHEYLWNHRTYSVYFYASGPNHPWNQIDCSEILLLSNLI